MPEPRARVFFMHIMKTAGTSYSWGLVHQFGPGEVFPPRGPERSEAYWVFDRFADLSAEDRAKVRLVHGHYPLHVRELVDADVTLTLLRHPIDRLISHLRQVARSLPGDEVPSIEEVYEQHPLIPATLNYQLRQFSRDVDDDPVVLDESHLEKGVGRLAEVDVIGLSERYEEFVQTCNDRYGWSVPSTDRLQVAPTSEPVPASFRARLERDNELDVEFHRRALEHLAGRNTSWA